MFCKLYVTSYVGTTKPAVLILVCLLVLFAVYNLLIYPTT